MTVQCITVHSYITKDIKRTRNRISLMDLKLRIFFQGYSPRNVTSVTKSYHNDTEESTLLGKTWLFSKFHVEAFR